jgi:hypothetical protein
VSPGKARGSRDEFIRPAACPKKPTNCGATKKAKSKAFKEPVDLCVGMVKGVIEIRDYSLFSVLRGKSVRPGFWFYLAPVKYSLINSGALS